MTPPVEIATSQPVFHFEDSPSHSPLAIAKVPNRIPSGFQTLTPSPTLPRISKVRAPHERCGSRTTTVYVAHGIRVDSIGKANGAVGKQSPVLQALSVRSDVELVDRCYEAQTVSDMLSN